MAVTIKDVAKLASVAPSTVSRVIANNPRISEKTKRKVKEAMQSLGYHPNFNARSLANKATQAIGLVMPSSADTAFQNPFFPEVIRGISTKAHEQNYALYMSTGQTEDEIFEGVMGMVQGKRVDGIVMLYSRVDDRIMQYLHEQDFPFTVIGKPFRNAEEMTYIDTDNYRAAKEMTEYLVSLGHERIGFVGGDLNLIVTIDRLLGYEHAIRSSNLSYRDEYIVHEEFLMKGGQEAVKELFSLSEPPTALLVMDDLMSFGVLSTLSELGLSVPEDVSVLSFNNVLLSELSTPPLTSVDINIFQLGYEAANGLLEKIHSPETPSKKVLVPYKLVTRNSCKSK